VRRGFPLTELVAVIVIIATLAAMLFIVFERAHEKPNPVSCQDNLRRIGVAIAMYAGDWHETLPANYSYNPPPSNLLWWHDVVQPYVKDYQLFICPSDQPSSCTHLRPRWPGIPDPLLFSYSANSNGGGGTRPIGGWGGGCAMAMIQSVSDTILIAESNDIELNTYQTEVDAWAPDGIGTIDKRHNGGCNWLFADGHVKYLTRSQQNMWTIAAD